MIGGNKVTKIPMASLLSKKEYKQILVYFQVGKAFIGLTQRNKIN